MQEHLTQCHNMKKIDNCLSTRNVAAHICFLEQQEFVIENPRKHGIEVRVGMRRLVRFAPKEMPLSLGMRVGPLV